MGDKGGKKDKSKSNKQKNIKEARKEQEKQKRQAKKDGQPKSTQECLQISEWFNSGEHRIIQKEQAINDTEYISTGH